MKPALLTLTLCFAAAAAEGVVDRVAVVVGNEVITESEVLRELRLTAFLNGEALDSSAAQRRTAAERLVDQQLIRNEMTMAGYPMPAEAEGDAVLRSFRQQNYRSVAAFRESLEKYGLTEDELKRHLLWQKAALRFTDQRFRMAMQAPPAESANRAADGERSSEKADDPMEAWLKEARNATRIQFKKGAFQ